MLQPLDPQKNVPASMQIYDDHVKYCYELYETHESLQQELKAK